MPHVVLTKSTRGAMRFVVTGVLGFVGSHFAEHALAQGHQVIGICNSPPSQKQALRLHLRSHGAQLVDGDILDPVSLQDTLAGADCVCHFAAAFRESCPDEAHFMRLNVRGTINLIEAAAYAKVRRFVLCSTAGVYGQRVEGVIDESFPMHPWNVYERSKLVGENEVRTRAAELGIEHVILRPASVYGPRDERLLKLFKSAAKGRFPLFGRGLGRRHMIYVVDLADAFLRAATTPNISGQELIIAGPQAVPLHKMLAELASVLNRRRCGPQLPLTPMKWLAAIVEDTARLLKVNPPIYRRRVDFYLSDAAFSTLRAQAVLDWRPRTQLREGLARTAEAYLKQGSIPSATAHWLSRRLKNINTAVLSTLPLASEGLNQALPLILI